MLVIVVLNIQNGFNNENTVVISIMKDTNMTTYPRLPPRWVTLEEILDGSGVLYPVANVILDEDKIRLDGTYGLRHYYKLTIIKI